MPILNTLLSKYLRWFNARHLQLWPHLTDYPCAQPGKAYLLYIHVPFCESLCPFCSFHRVRFERISALEYFQALRRELRLYHQAGFNFTELYVGGGTPTVLPEQLATLLELAAHYRFEPRPVAVARGNEKGRVERAIRHIREAFFAARQWRDLDDLNAQAAAWCQGQAADRPCPEDRSISVREAFAQEQPKLLALPENPFPTDERKPVSANKTPYVRFDLNDYSIPPTHVQRTLTVVASPTEVRVLDGAAVIAAHARSYDKGEQVEDPAHVAELTARKRQARQHRGTDRLAQAAPNSAELLARAAERVEVEGAAGIVDVFSLSEAIALSVSLILDGIDAERSFAADESDESNDETTVVVESEEPELERPTRLWRLTAEIGAGASYGMLEGLRPLIYGELQPSLTVGGSNCVLSGEAGVRWKKGLIHDCRVSQTHML